MNDTHFELARRWIHKAENDLITARHTLTLPKGPTDTVCFHAQQAVEKVLKAFLTFNQTEFPKTHNLVYLLDKTHPLAPELEKYRAAFAEMSNHAVEIRYPDDWFEPLREEAEQSLAIAEEVVGIIKSKIRTFQIKTRDKIPLDHKRISVNIHLLPAFKPDHLGIVRRFGGRDGHWFEIALQKLADRSEEWIAVFEYLPVIFPIHHAEVHRQSLPQLYSFFNVLQGKIFPSGGVHERGNPHFSIASNGGRNFLVGPDIKRRIGKTEKVF